jgi:hypothetical protein
VVPEVVMFCVVICLLPSILRQKTCRDFHL